MASEQSQLHCADCGHDVLVITREGLFCARCGKLVRAMPSSMRPRAAGAVRRLAERHFVVRSAGGSGRRAAPSRAPLPPVAPPARPLFRHCVRCQTDGVVPAVHSLCRIDHDSSVMTSPHGCWFVVRRG